MVRSLPITLLHDVKGGCLIFAVCAVGGSVIYFVEGTSRSSSRGCRLAGGVQEVIAKGPRVGRWAALSGVFFTIAEVMFERWDVKAPLNMVVAGGAAKALFSMHRGKHAAVCEGIKGAAYAGIASTTIYSIGCILDSGRSSH